MFLHFLFIYFFDGRADSHERTFNSADCIVISFFKSL